MQTRSYPYHIWISWSSGMRSRGREPRANRRVATGAAGARRAVGGELAPDRKKEEEKKPRRPHGSRQERRRSAAHVGSGRPLTAPVGSLGHGGRVLSPPQQLGSPLITGSNP